MEEYLERKNPMCGENHIRDTIYSFDLHKETAETMMGKIIDLVINDKVYKPLITMPLLTDFNGKEREVFRSLIINRLDYENTIFFVGFHFLPFLGEDRRTGDIYFYLVLSNFRKDESSFTELDLLENLRYYYEFVLISLTDDLRNYLQKNSIGDEETKEKIADIDYFREKVFNMANIDAEINFMKEDLKKCQSLNLSEKFHYLLKLDYEFRFLALRDMFIRKYDKTS